MPKGILFKDLNDEAQEIAVNEQMEAVKRFCTPTEIKRVTRETIIESFTNGGTKSALFNSDGTSYKYQ